MSLAPWGDAAAGLAVALGAGLLIGLERERRKGRGPGREAAGIRTFTLAALGGALAQVLGQPLLVMVGALAVGALAAMAYWASRDPARSAAAGGDDPGLTTELALVVTYLVGVLAVQQPGLGAAAGAIVAGLLAARERLHRLATRVMTEAELHDLLLLAALALVLLPLLPTQPLPALGLPMSPRALMVLLLLILGLQAAGHVATRWLGGHAGLLLAGFFSGFVSSTATVAAMGARARRSAAAAAAGHPAPTTSLAGAAAGGAIASTAATWVQAMLLLAVAAPAAARAFAPVAGAGLLVTLAWVVRRARRPRPAGAPSPADAHATHALRLREALLAAAWLAGAAWAVSAAQRHFGTGGLWVGTTLAGLADAHAPVAALAALHAAGQADTATVCRGALLAISSNSLLRMATAWVAGGAAFAMRVSLPLIAAAAAAWALLLAGPV